MSETEPKPDSESQPATAKASPRLSKSCFLLPLLVVLFVWLLVNGTAFFEFLFRLVCGWGFYLGRTLPNVRWDFAGLLEGLLLGGIAVGGLAILLRGWRKETRYGKNALGICLLIAVLFGTCLAAVGLLHHGERLMGSRWIEYGYGPRFVPTRSKWRAMEAHLSFQEYLATHPQKEGSNLREAYQKWRSQDRESFNLSYVTLDSANPPEEWQFVPEPWQEEQLDAPTFISPRKAEEFWIISTLEQGAQVVSDEELAILMLKIRSHE